MIRNTRHGQGPEFPWRRSQVLRRSGEPIAHLLYLLQNGAPVVIYAKLGNDAHDGIGVLPEDIIQAIAWNFAEISYLLTAQLPKVQVEQLALAVRYMMEAY